MRKTYVKSMQERRRIKTSCGRRRNKGSAIIEMTILIPIFLFCVYFFIMLLIHLINVCEKMDILCEKMYSVNVSDKSLDSLSAGGDNIKREGSTIKISFVEKGKMFDYDIELQRDGNNATKNIRRWQLATGEL